MNFTPKSKDERDNSMKNYDGIAEFTIDNAFEKISLTGNPMCEVHLKHNISGFIIKHWVSFGDSSVAHHFAEKFFNCIGVAYPESGTFEPRDLIGLTGVANFEYKDDERGNVGQDGKPKKYLKVKEFVIAAKEAGDPQFNDDIPF